jgi:hypothetical protein
MCSRWRAGRRPEETSRQREVGESRDLSDLTELLIVLDAGDDNSIALGDA